jgi:hypothetical protein
MARKLKVVLVVDSLEIPYWLCESIKRIHRSNYAEIGSVFQIRRLEKETLSSFRWRGKVRHLLFRAYSSLEEWVLWKLPNPLKKEDLRKILSDTPIAEVVADWEGLSYLLPDHSIQSIATIHPDVILNLSIGYLVGSVLGLARYGVWSLVASDEMGVQSQPADFWAVMTKSTTLRTLLIAECGTAESTRVLYESFTPVHTWSCKKTMQAFCWNAIAFIPRELERIYLYGEREFLTRQSVMNAGIDLWRLRQVCYPVNWEMTLLLVKQLLGYLKYKLSSFIFLNQWTLLFDLGTGEKKSPAEFVSLENPPGRFWADPHVITKNGEYYIFFEDYHYKERKGNISVVKMDKNGRRNQSVAVLEKPYHLSYPFVFEWQGNYYLVPESARGGQIQLYKCSNFPLKWEFERNLLENIRAYDATLFHHHGIWWLFATISNEYCENSTDELFLYYCRDFVVDEWKPHPLNPIVSDARRSRPAGKIFVNNDKIFRPCQDSSKRYGYGIRINEILILTETEYSEIDADFMEPVWDKRIIGMHTYNVTGNLTLIDAMIRRPRFW